MRPLVIISLLSALFVGLLWNPVDAVQAAQSEQPTTVNIAAGDVPALIKAMNAANASHTVVVINLAQNATYNLTVTDHSPIYEAGRVMTIQFDPHGLPVVTTEITINGNGSTIQRTGKAQFQLFLVFAQGNLTLTDLTLTGGDLASGDGGALGIMGGSASVINCTLTGNSAENGGAINSIGGLTISHSRFTNNSASSAGGAVALSTPFGAATITDSLFSENNAGNAAQRYVGGQGGAINVDAGGSAVLSSNQIVNNNAEEGGGLYIGDSASAQVNMRTRIEANRSTADATQSDIPFGGAGISLYRGSLTVDQAIVDNNVTAFAGGALFNREGIFTITNSLITHNTAVLGGGVISVNMASPDGNDPREGKIHVNNTCIVGNTDLQAGTQKVAGLDGMNNAPDAPKIDSANDWWGSPSGPGGEVSGKGDGVYGKAAVTYQPFLTTPAPACITGVPTPVATAALAPTIVPTAASVATRCTPTDPRYTIQIPAGELATANITCELAPDGSTYSFIAINNDTSLPMPIPSAITICFQGKIKITFLSMTGGSGLPVLIPSTSQNGFTCVRLKDSGVLFLNPPLSPAS